MRKMRNNLINIPRYICPPVEKMARKDIGRFDPISSEVTSGFGQPWEKTKNGKVRFHKGIDIFTPVGTTVLSILDGTVVESFHDGATAGIVTIQHSPNLRSRYLHLSTRAIATSQTVRKGGIIGSMGGLDGKPSHLHFEMLEANNSDSRRCSYTLIDPLPYVIRGLYKNGKANFTHIGWKGFFRKLSYKVDKILYSYNHKENSPEFVRISMMPDNLINSLVAAEDKRFFRHHGLDIFSVFRALYHTMFLGNVQGGSTITQQMVRIIALPRKFSVKRKIQEMVLSLIIERKVSKKAIIELYLNSAYYGTGFFGIRTTCMRLFDTDPEKLNLLQCTFIVALLKIPIAQHPTYSKLHRIILRQRYILGRMYKLGYISQPVYTNGLKALSDHEQTKDEITILNECQEKMNISPTDAEKIRKEVVSEIRKKE